MDQLQLPGIETGPTEDTDAKPSSASETQSTTEIEIPDKFQNEDGSINVNSLLKSYTELEKSRNTPTEEEKPKEESPPTTSQSLTPDEAISISDEIAANGGVSDETYALLEAKGLSKNMADSYLEGQKAIAEKMKVDLWEPVGGEKAYTKMLEWAVDNLESNEIKSYDKIMMEGDMETKKLTVQGLSARYHAENPASPKLISGNVGRKGSSNAFESWAQVTEAMRDPRYDKDEAYRNKIEQRLAVSDL